MADVMWKQVCGQSERIDRNPPNALRQGQTTRLPGTCKNCLEGKATCLRKRADPSVIRLANGQEGRGAGITDELVIVCHRGASPGRSLDLERCINHRGSSETWRRAYREGSDRRHTRSVRAKTAALGRPSGADFGPTQDEDALLTHSDRRHPQGGAGGSAGLVREEQLLHDMCLLGAVTVEITQILTRAGQFDFSISEPLLR
jgi:hypothetical protein